jgi:predicted ATP-grasp superfamily ATP-dependent carboligase
MQGTGRIFADVPVPGTEVAVGRPVLSVMAVGDSPSEIEPLLRYRIGGFESRLYDATARIGE